MRLYVRPLHSLQIGPRSISVSCARRCKPTSRKRPPLSLKFVPVPYLRCYPQEDRTAATMKGPTMHQPMKQLPVTAVWAIDLDHISGKAGRRVPNGKGAVARR